MGLNYVLNTSFPKQLHNCEGHKSLYLGEYVDFYVIHNDLIRVWDP